MKHDYEFEFKRIKLRPLYESDIEMLRILRNANRQYFSTQSEITPEQQRIWYQSYLNREDDIMFAVELLLKPGEFVGAISLYDVDRNNGVAECGRTVIDKTKVTERGVGMEATVAVCLFGFEMLKVRKIIGYVLKNNERIIKVDTRAGFRIVGDYDEKSYKIEMTRDTIILD